MEDKLWKVEGTDRKRLAIGIFEPFTITVRAPNEESARFSARTQRNNDGREHVHIKRTTLVS